jgi:beta-N-acetylhexosaminidase
MDELRETEFIPFSEGINVGVDFIMVGHQSVTGLGDELPCDLSYKAVTEILRGELGFEGIAITDSQQMNTISKVYSSGEAAKLSIKAGMDIILMPVDYRQAVNDVCDAVRSGEISEERINESVMRILRKKYALGLLKK